VDNEPIRSDGKADGKKPARQISVPCTSRRWNVNVYGHTPPAPDASREAAWLEASAPGQGVRRSAKR